MPTFEINDRTWNTAHQCVAFVFHSEQLCDLDFKCRVGTSRHEAHKLIAEWDYLDRQYLDQRAILIIHNSFNEVCNGLYLSPEEWRSSFADSCKQVESAFAEWMQAIGFEFEEGSDLD